MEVTKSLLSGKELAERWMELDRQQNLSERTRAERARGRLYTITAQAEALVKEVKTMYGITAELAVDISSDNEDDWKVTLRHADFTVVDSWKAFPTEEFMANLMLLGMTK